MKAEYAEGTMSFEHEVSYNHTPSLVARTAYFYVQAIGHFCCNGDYSTRREGYRSFLLIYTIKGKGHAKYRGKQYELGKCQILLIDCYHYQEYFSDRHDWWEMKWVHFNGGGSEGYFNTIYENFGPVIDMSEDNPIPSYIDALIGLVKNNDIQLEIKASSIIVQILTAVMLAASRKDRDYMDSSHNSQVEAALEFIEKNHDSRISLEDIAKAACCSMYHFTRVFKRVTGYSPHEYLVKYRINRAKTLLKTTEKSVDEISGGVGFESTSNFIRTFRQLEGVTPLKYRKFWVG